MVYNYIQNILTVLEAPLLLLAVTAIASTCKTVLLGMLVRSKARTKVPRNLLLWLVLIMVSSLIIESGWMLKLLRKTLIPSISYSFTLCILRFGWLFFTVQYLALSFFIDHMINPQKKQPHTSYQIICLVFASLLILLQLIIIVFSYSTTQDKRSALEFILQRSMYWYAVVTVIPALYDAVRAIRSKRFPKIVTAQLKIFILYIIGPHIILELGLSNPLLFSSAVSQSTIYLFLSITKILFTYGLYMSTRRMIGLRFLNIKDHVDTHYHSTFVNNFKDVLEQLASVTSTKEIKYITHNFFKQAFAILPDHVQLFLRNPEKELVGSKQHMLDIRVESLLHHPKYADAVSGYLSTSKVIIRDEIEFSHFYKPSPLREFLIDSMKALDADIFIPVYAKQLVVGYIVVKHNARSYKLYTSNDRDEMTIFAAYIGSIINLLEHGDIQKLTKDQKKLTEELYNKHQEINQYKESMRSFLRTTRERKIGILFYKNRRFSFGNQAAQELIEINPNQEEGHHLTQTLKKIAVDAQTYKTTQNTITRDTHGNKLVVSAIPRIDDASTIITVYYPEIADTIRTYREFLKDPTEWDYLLYLETTQPGQLINNLIPGSSETLLNFKIHILRAALSRKAVLIDMPHNDIRPIVEIIHHISLRSELRIIHMTSPEMHHEVALKLFGINPLYGTQEKQPFLEELSTSGTLFIENVDLLHLDTQNALADFILYGYFNPLKSDKKISSNVRLMFSSQQNLRNKVREGTFSATLFEQIASTTLHLPPLVTLHENELNELIDGYLEQSLKTKELKNLLELTDKERARILTLKPLSLQDFKEHVTAALHQKSHKKKINEITFDPVYTITDPELSSAIRLGKRALKDPRIMAMLWDKFKSQTKIAAVLGVNRSSVNRRCQEYHLI